MRSLVVLCVVAGCGSSAKKPAADPHQAELEAAERRDKAIEAMKPASPYELRERDVPVGGACACIWAPE